MRALIIVDIQNDFVTGGRLEVPQGEQIIPLVNRISGRFDLVVATQDWHPEDHKSFASNHSDKRPFDVIMLGGLQQTLWPDHCVQGSRGAELHSLLETNCVQGVFRKGMDPDIDSYSGFFDNGHKRTTGLGGYLKEREIRTVYVCGLAADYCVFYTARDARQLGFDTLVIEDATRAIDPKGFESAKEEILRIGGQVTQTTFID